MSGKNFMLTPVNFFFLFMIAVVSAASQLCLKQGANAGGRKSFFASFFSFWVVLGVALMGASVFASTWMLRNLPLNVVMPITALVYVLVPIGAFSFFKEKPRPIFWIGALLILLGICIIALF